MQPVYLVLRSTCIRIRYERVCACVRVCVASGLSHFADDGPLFESAIPFTKQVIAAYGPDRMVWGSGPPAIVDVHMAGYGEAERAQVKGGNLEMLLKRYWPAAGAKL